jgi:hypothetical protein
VTIQPWWAEAAAEERAAVAAANAKNASEILEGAWIVTCHHEHCEQCTAQIDNAVAHAKVTGSVGATYNVQGSDGINHGARVERETYAQRRAALGEDS